jgi:hypothetical protein
MSSGLPDHLNAGVCGTIEDSASLVHLGNHPEVTVCISGAHSLSYWAWEIEDQARTGLAVASATGSGACARSSSGGVGTTTGWSVDRWLRWIGWLTP